MNIMETYGFMLVINMFGRGFYNSSSFFENFTSPLMKGGTQYGN